MTTYIKAALTGFAALILSCGSAHAAVVWSDEFDDPKIDTDTWTWDVASHGFGNGQMEYATSRGTNSFIENGSLVLQAIREDYFGQSFTSSRLNTQGRFAFKYGTIEARIKLPDTANGLWPAFWMLGNNFPGIVWPDAGEIDILESGSAAGIANGTQNELINCAIHYSDAADEYEYQADWIKSSDLGLSNDLSADYHQYKLEWTPTELKFSLDGNLWATYDITAANFDEFRQPCWVILNIAVGGFNYVENTDPAAVTALPTAGSTAKMYVDWVRVSDNVDTEIFLGADTAETGNFGVFTETTTVDNSLVYVDVVAGDDLLPGFNYSDEAAIYTWNNMNEAAVPATPSEGTEVMSFDVGNGAWFGMGIMLPNFRNMQNFSDGFLNFDIQTTLTDDIKIGVKSSRGGESWQWLVGDGTVGLGFPRDGQWHTVRMPVNGFANCDFNTIQQIFMVAADSASASTTVSFDNIYWEQGVARVKPSGGSFGVFTEDAAHKTAGEFVLGGVDGNLWVWGDTLNPLAMTPYEGSNSASWASAGLGWFGAAWDSLQKYDLSRFDNPNGKLNFAMKTLSTQTFYIGMKSGNVIGPDSPEGWANEGPAGVGQVYFKFASGSDPYGFVRDGTWNTIEIPIADIAADADLSAMNNLFQILGVDGEIAAIEIDDVYYSGGKAGVTNIISAVVQDGVGISWPSTDGSIYTLQWKADPDTNTVWNSLSPTVEGDWTTKTAFDPFGSDPARFYQVLED